MARKFERTNRRGCRSEDTAITKIQAYADLHTSADQGSLPAPHNFHTTSHTEVEPPTERSS